jgi:hypothetical protein
LLQAAALQLQVLLALLLPLRLYPARLQRLPLAQELPPAPPLARMQPPRLLRRPPPLPRAPSPQARHPPQQLLPGLPLAAQLQQA